MSRYDHRFKSLETDVIHAGAPRPPVEGAVVTPIFQSANYLMADEASYDAVRYIRLSNSPNHYALQARLATIEGGEAALVTASGMAAIAPTLMSFVKQGEHLLTQQGLYGGTQTFLDHDGPGLGFSHTAIDGADPSSWGAALRLETRVIYVEAIANPLMSVPDLRAVVAFARAHGLISVIDNTFASPVNFRPLELGFDLAVHSATKYLNGHSDIVAGAVIGRAEHVAKVRQLQLHLGASLDPHACFLFERGLKTLVLRVERQNRNAQLLAEYLASRSDLGEVRYPGLPQSPGHAFAKELFAGFGGMLAFYVGDAVRAEQALERLRIPLHAASLGGVESLVVRPSKSSHLGLQPEERAALGITDDLIRVSVGIENIDELIADFASALDDAAT